MTSLTPKLTAVITTIAMLAPAAGAHAATFQTLRPARHYASPPSQHRVSPDHSRRSPAKFRPDSHGI